MRRTIVGAVLLALAGCTSEENINPLAVLSGPPSARVGEPAIFDGSLSTDPDGRIASWVFDFGDGKSSAMPQASVASHVYAEAKPYVVTLTVTDDAGGTHSASQEIVVTANAPPSAAFTAAAIARIKEPVSFDASGSSDPDGTIVKYAWDFGDGNNGSGPSLSHAFEKPGPYEVKLTVTDNDEAESSTTRSVEILPNQLPVPNIAGPATARVDEIVAFDGSASSDPDGLVAKYEWDFDYDGNSFEADPDAGGPIANHAFDKAGPYTVALRVTDNDAESSITTHPVEVIANAPPVAVINGPAKVRINEIASFDGSGSSDPDGKITSYEWDFEYDGKDFKADATGPDANTTFSKDGAYTVALRVTDNDGDSSLVSHVIAVTPNLPPVAKASGPAKVRIDEPASFNAAGSSDPDGQIAKYEWDFEYDGKDFKGDAAGPAVNHAFPKAGSFAVALRVTDNDGAAGTTTHAITVTPNEPPSAAMTGPSKVRVNELALFDGAGSQDPDGKVVKYEWDFDYDGKVFGTDGSGPKATHAYAPAGSYLVALRVTDNDGDTDIDSQPIEVTPNQAPKPAIAGPAQVRIDELASFDGSGSTDPDGLVAKHEWDFDYDGKLFDVNATGPTVGTSYPKAGSYTVALRVTDNDGESTTTTHALVVTPNQAPSAALQGPVSVRIGELASFDGSGSTDPDGKIAKHEWDFDYDGKIFDVNATGATANTTYAKAGSYTVALRVTDNDGGEHIATAVLVATPNQVPVATLKAPTSVRIDQIASFDGSGSTDPDGLVAKHEWDFDYDGKIFDVNATGPTANTSYPKAGSYTVALRVTDNDGGEHIATAVLVVTPNQPPVASLKGPAQVRINQIAGFDGSGSKDADGVVANYEWDFDHDGQNFDVDGSGVKVNTSWGSAGSYLVGLRVTDNDGGENLATDGVAVTPNQAPAAAIKGPAQVRIDETASFDGGGSSDPDGKITSYEWDLDYDGNNFDVDATGPTVNTTYPNDGSYTVALRVTDNDGDENLATHVLTVKPNQAPAAAIKGPAQVRMGEIASFDATASSDADGKVVKHEWDFDYDGNSFDIDATGPTVNTTYPSNGSFLVALRVTDNDGAEDVTTHALTVKPNQAPVAAIKGPAQVRIDEIASFDGAGSSDADGQVVKYEWDFDYAPDNFTLDATGPTANTFYPNAGSYVVALQVTDNDGAVGFATAAIEVAANKAPVAVIAGPTKGDLNELLSFDGSGSSDTDGTVELYEWDFDYDGNNFDVEAAGAAVNHAYLSPGAYTLALRVTDNDGATNIATRQVTIEQLSILTIISVNPSSGPRQGGTTVTIAGTGFTLPANGNAVTFGGNAATVLTRPDPTTLVVVTPAGVPGPVDVTVANGNGSATLPNGYAYGGGLRLRRRGQPRQPGLLLDRRDGRLADRLRAGGG
ncbi:MAG: PKD domain-containing protein [Deltaproteobacteria bacterium]|nr:PKD domain-containing protein [Deltaproteobacteria bacterium]